ncbi:unnamed protein product [Cuscuta epithymum]|uniref:Uncharacterized protein n=1 Tax=Cuscuta epithymum TaxID=186058 RepID=A0AAV0CRR0_9ASTE|nr:unnamed protein product [Cuscuta epithymum]
MWLRLAITSGGWQFPFAISGVVGSREIPSQGSIRYRRRKMEERGTGRGWIFDTLLLVRPRRSDGASLQTEARLELLGVMYSIAGGGRPPGNLSAVVEVRAAVFSSEYLAQGSGSGRSWSRRADSANSMAGDSATGRPSSSWGVLDRLAPEVAAYSSLKIGFWLTGSRTELPCSH